jgi:hypothetical protein
MMGAEPDPEQAHAADADREEADYGVRAAALNGSPPTFTTGVPKLSAEPATTIR